MKTTIFILCLILLITQINFAQDLPRYRTEDEKKTVEQYLPFESRGSTTPPAFPVRTPAEWEEMEGILISFDNIDYDDDILNILSQIVDYAQEEGTVYILCTNQSVVENYLTLKSIPLTNLSFIIQDNVAYIWTRDFGPISVYENYVDNLNFIDWKYYTERPIDDATPQDVADYLGTPLYHTTVFPYDLFNYGGNFMSDGNGIGFSTHLIFDDNALPNVYPAKTETEINSIMEAFTGIDTYIKLETLPTNAIDHIDMYMKLLDEETILVGEYDTGVNGSENNAQIEENIDYILNNFNTCFDREYEIIRIPMPEIYYYESYPVQRTYTNSLILNSTVLVPVYGINPVMDANALSIYNDAMPGYNIVSINCNALIPYAGAIHCVTMGIGASSPIYIEHAKIRAYQADEDVDRTGPYEIRALMKSQTAISSASLYWSNSPGSGYQQLPLVDYGSDNYLAYIPPQAPGNTVYYYLSATNAEKTITKPIPADEGAYIGFQVDADADPPVNLSFSDEEVKSGIEVEFQASNSIMAGSNYVIKNGADVTFTAGNAITLNGGTTIELGAAFCADVDPNFMNSLAKRVATTSGSASSAHSHNESEEQGEKDQSSRQEDIPMQFNLLQNYPNPFNPTTTIQYTLKEGCYVILKIYNISGQEVRTLVNEYQTAGYKATTWDGRNNSGQPVPSGIYLYKIRAADFTEFKKMALVK